MTRFTRSLVTDYDMITSYGTLIGSFGAVIGVILTLYSINESSQSLKVQLREQEKATAAQIVSDFISNATEDILEEKHKDNIYLNLTATRTQLILNSTSSFPTISSDLIRFIGNSELSVIFNAPKQLERKLESDPNGWNAAKIKGMNLSNSLLEDTYLSGIQIVCSNLSATKLNSSDLKSSSIRNSNLSYSILANADLSGSKINSVSFNGAALKDINLKKASLKNTDLRNVRWPLDIEDDAQHQKIYEKLEQANLKRSENIVIDNNIATSIDNKNDLIEFDGLIVWKPTEKLRNQRSEQHRFVKLWKKNKYQENDTCKGA